MSVLRIEDLCTHYFLGEDQVQAVDNVTFDIAESEIFGLAGESGCGKTTAAYSIMRILPENGAIVNGRIFLDDEDVVVKTEEEMRQLRWRKVSIVFQY
ncbi:MAG: ATP-binding cassette domain-containing protein, partial [Candidatus Odinarchaeota archaeon]